MRDAINNFPKQFAFEPEVVNAEKLATAKKFVVCGMGGSNLAADVLRIWDPSLDIITHRDYGLPVAGDLKKRLVILSSYSGNTEEVLAAWDEIHTHGVPVAVLATGGELLKRAQEAGVAHVVMPETGIQPRMSFGFNIRGLMKLMGLEVALDESKQLATSLDPAAAEKQGKKLAARLKGSVPVIYSSLRNHGIARNWKIKFNETGKIPAFYNSLPELNHNEMTGFDVADASRALSEHFYFLILKDPEDNPRIHKRMEILEKLYADRGLSVETITLEGDAAFYKAAVALMIADWAAFYTAEGYGLESEQVPMVEEFKKLIK